MTRKKPLWCRLGMHDRTRVVFGKGGPAQNYQVCRECGAVWRATYDGIEPGWKRIPLHVAELHEKDAA